MNAPTYFVYRNLGRASEGTWSIRDTRTGLVVAHAQGVLLRDATMKVSESGRQRVLREKRKNVHAGVQGQIIAMHGYQPYKGRAAFYADEVPWVTSQSRTMFYNPYKVATFTDKEGGFAVKTARIVYLPNGSLPEYQA